MEQKYEYLLKSIRDAVRKKAQEIPDFRNGCIRVTSRPCCAEADEWLGGISDWEQQDIAEYEHVFTITPRGGYTIVVNYGPPGPEKVNCYSHSALKVAHCSLARKRIGALISGVYLGDHDLTEDNGWAHEYGAICIEVSKNNCGDYCRIYVSVSGADPFNDLRCAEAAVEAVNGYFSVDQYSIRTPRFFNEE
ncbi:hypothetical protein IKG12_00475 [Candidatus Saccharibacteria bacterium]|nr:hypothetical protein [Candidatus Saccharibacteria bacterium]